ncbi:MAG: hypothetical protein KKB45_03350 [Gammaproteobacteria bacterium]|nr:hypothetical protein [Gammaproteobacteria bacterium]
MALELAVARNTTPTTTGTVDLTVSGFGTPQAAMFFLNYATSDGTPLEATVFASFGFTDGTNLRGIAHYVEDGQTTTDAKGTISNTWIVAQVDDTTVTKYATFDSWIADGVRLNWVITFGSAPMTITCVLFKGASGASVFTFTPNATQDATAEKSDLSFAPELLFFGAMGGTTPGVVINSALISFGAARKIDASTSEQRHFCYWNKNGVADVNAGAIVSTTRCVSQTFDGVLSWSGDITAWGANGFTMTTRDGGSGNDIVIGLALDLNGAQADVIDIDSPTSTGTKKYPLSFQPTGLFSVMSNLSAKDTIQDTDSFSYGVTDGTNKYVSEIGDQDGAASSNTHSLVNQGLVENQSYSGATPVDFLVATLSSFDADGVTYNWTTVDASARYGFALAIGGAAAGLSIPVAMQNMRGGFTPLSMRGGFIN